jgi:signal transduction histidine kinase
MMKRRFRQPSIRLKLILTLAVLLSIVVVQIAISTALSDSEEEAIEELQDSQRRASLAQELQLAAQKASWHETTATIQIFTQGPEAIPPYLNLAYAELDRTTEMIAILRQEPSIDQAELDQVEDLLALNRSGAAMIVDDMLPARGDESHGLVADFLEPIYVVNQTYDVIRLLELAEDYVLNYSWAASNRIPAALSDTEAEIEASDLPDAKKRALLSQIGQARTAFITIITHDRNVQQQFDLLNDQIEEANTLLRDIVVRELAAQEAARADFEQSQDSRRDLQWGTSLLLVLLGSVLAYTLSRDINQPIITLTDSANKLAGGDYSVRANLPRRDEFGRLGQAFDKMASEVEVRDRAIRQQSEKLEVALAKAQEAAEIKAEFLSTMSHELRTPLHAIESFTGIMLNKMGGAEYNEKTSGYLQRVATNSKRLLGLINDFLDLSRIEAGRIELADMPFQPAKLAWQWYDELGVLADKKGLDFVMNIDPNMPHTLYGDEEALSKIALNLLDNAIKFTEKGSVKLSLRPNGDSWQIAVTDTGIGIPPHAREYIFDEFRQVDQSSKRRYGGTGLGLSIVQRFARSMGGNVTLESEMGEGSTFTVTLPMKTDQ